MTALTAHAGRCPIVWRGETLSLELQWLEPKTDADAAGDLDRPLLVFLHEGLGSVSMWKDFPRTLCQALGWAGLVYSRPGYGQSDAPARFRPMPGQPRPEQCQWPADFLEQQALEVLPALLEALKPRMAHRPLWLLGHSDGGSIALIHAAAHPHPPAGLIVMAPHILVEAVSLASIQAARTAFGAVEASEAGGTSSPLRAGLARHHRDPDGVFWGWNGVWLSPGFRDWNLAATLPRITCPVLAVQGEDDVYGTLAQIEGIRAAAPQTELRVLAACGHSPHRDQPERLLAEIVPWAQAQARSRSQG